MVLQSLGIEAEEAELCDALGADDDGTPFENLLLLEDWRPGSVKVEEFSESPSVLFELLGKGLAPIVIIGPPKPSMSDWRHRLYHALVVTEVGEDTVVFHDPLRSSGESASRVEFFDLWSRSHHQTYATRLA